MDWIKYVEDHLAPFTVVVSLIGTFIAAPLALARYVKSIVKADTTRYVERVRELEMAINRLETELEAVPATYISKSEHSEIMSFIKEELRGIRQNSENFSTNLTQRVDQILFKMGGYSNGS